MSWQGVKTQLGEVKDAYLDPLFDKPDSAEEILQKIKNKELGIEWWEEETRKLNALKNLIPEKRQQQVGSILSQAGEMFDTAWKGAETVENWYNPFDVGAAGTAHTINLFNKGVGLLSQGVAAGLHHGARIHKPVSDLGGNVASVALTRKLMSGTSNLLRSGQLPQAARNIFPTSRFNPASGKVVKVASTPVHGLGITAESSKTISKQYPFLVRNVSRTNPITDLTQIKKGSVYAMLSTEPVTSNSSLLGDAIATRTPPKSRIERLDETTHIDERNIKLENLRKLEERTGKKYPNERRNIMAEVGSHVKKWFDRVPQIRELKQPFLDHYKKRSNLKTDLASKIKKILGVPETNTGHVVSLKGSPSLKGQKITPYTSQDIVGSDLTKYIEEARSNRRHGEYNLFLNVLLQQIDRPVNQMEEAVWFVNNRPDLTDWTMADEIAESIKMNRLALGLDTGDTLELRELLEADLKRAGLFENKADAKVLKVLLDKFYSKDIIESATDPIQLLKEGKIQADDPRLKKKAWLSGAGRRGDYSVWTQYRHDLGKQPVIDEIIRKESKLKKLPSEATGK